MRARESCARPARAQGPGPGGRLLEPSWSASVKEGRGGYLVAFGALGPRAWDFTSHLWPFLGGPGKSLPPPSSSRSSGVRSP
eukprot:2702104-Pyramimonas_sp.AAC.1